MAATSLLVWGAWRLAPQRIKERLVAPPASAVFVTDRYGVPLQALLAPDQVYRRPVPLDDVSPWMVLALLAAEDQRFYTHPGVDLSSILRALYQNVSKGRVVSGASTLTQQLVRSLDPRPRTIFGKAREAVTALWLERSESKERILEGYLNHVSFANRYSGVEAAARGYFGVPSRDLSLGQSSLLAAIPKSPVLFDPLRHPQAARERQQWVLRRMVELGWLDEAGRERALAEVVSPRAPASPWVAPHFIRHLADKMPQDSREWRVTLDTSLQKDLQGLLRTHLASLKDYHVGNGAILVTDVASGDVLAWVGSADFRDEKAHGQVDAVVALRQPGSALKPFLYATAFQEGMRTSDMVRDEPLVDTQGFRPKNYDETYHGPTRLRVALACSYNVSAVRLLERVALGRFLEVLRDFGFTSLDKDAEFYGSGLALGNGEVTLEEMGAAYAALARGGLWEPARLSIDPPVFEPAAGARRAMDEESAYLVTDVLADNIARSEAFGPFSPLRVPFPFAAKTGTSKDYRDNWAAGYTPRWSVVVWVGNFDGSPMRRVSGITGAAPLLHDAAMRLYQTYPSGDFARPAGIREEVVCPVSGEAVGPHCPNRLLEVFHKDHLPERECQTHMEGRAQSVVEGPLGVRSPIAGAVFKLDPSVPASSQAIRLQSTWDGRGIKLGWRMDGKEIPLEGGEAWWPLEAGRHEVEVRTRELLGGDVKAISRFEVLP